MSRFSFLSKSNECSSRKESTYTTSHYYSRDWGEGYVTLLVLNWQSKSSLLWLQSLFIDKWCSSCQIASEMQILPPQANNLWFQNCFSTHCSDLMSIHAQNSSLHTITVCDCNCVIRVWLFWAQKSNDLSWGTQLHNYVQLHNFAQILKPGSHWNLKLCVHVLLVLYI